MCVCVCVCVTSPLKSRGVIWWGVMYTWSTITFNNAVTGVGHLNIQLIKVTPQKSPTHNNNKKAGNRNSYSRLIRINKFIFDTSTSSNKLVW